MVAIPFSFLAVHLYSPSSSALVSEIFRVTRSPLLRKSNLPPFLILSSSTNHSMSGKGSPSTRQRRLAGWPTHTSISSSSSVNFGWAVGRSDILQLQTTLFYVLVVQYLTFANDLIKIQISLQIKKFKRWYIRIAFYHFTLSYK